MAIHQFFDRDISWLTFNGRILDEAAKANVPLLERIQFLAIFSSNLDEFYRVRMPAIMLTKKVEHIYGIEGKIETPEQLLQELNQLIQLQQEQFGYILSQSIIPLLKKENLHFVYNETLPPEAQSSIIDYFHSEVLPFIQKIYIHGETKFFPENNKLYLFINFENDKPCIINIPSDKMPRFKLIHSADKSYIIFLDDIIRFNINRLFTEKVITGVHSLKVTRDAAMDLKDEYEGDIAAKIESQLLERDDGLATRVLYQPGLSDDELKLLADFMGFSKNMLVPGGTYHHLKDLFSIPINRSHLSYPTWNELTGAHYTDEDLFTSILKKDSIIHTPYQDYGKVIRFFAEAATDEAVTEIYTTLYRVAGDSKIANALITAAKNGKRVTVFVELKARFDEANNLKWSKLMKAAGVKIINSIPGLKVHAKVALVKRRMQHRYKYFGLLSTGNLNEATAKIYTDHILFTSNHKILAELELLFIFLTQRRMPLHPKEIVFKHLLVAQFNLQEHFLQCIDREIAAAKAGKKACITIKLNNLEERILIAKLYEASCAGVEIKMMVRSICCLVPGMAEMSENISIIRMVDRYLEHGRIFIFHNDGKDDIYLGSSDWMNRNIYRRIEVCFPVYDSDIKAQIQKIISAQQNDNEQATNINSNLQNIPVLVSEKTQRAQKQIYSILNQSS